MGKHLAPPPSPPRRPRSAAFGVVTIAALALLAVVSATIGWRMHAENKGFLPAVTGLFVPDPQKYFANSRLFVLIVGLDYDYDEKDNEYSKNARTDTIKVAAIDLPSRSINLVSVPRDMDFVFPSGHEGKINEGHAICGVGESQRDIAQFLGLPKFDRYVLVRINAVKDLINAVGGIDLAVEKKMDYDDNWGHLHIHLKPGMQHLNGDQAVGYSRFRHDETGDIGRIERQDKVIRTLVAKLKSDKLNDLAHINELIGVLRRDVETNFTFDEEVSLANAFSNIDPKGMKTAQIPYTGDKNIAAGNVLIPDEAGKVAMVNKLLLGPMGPEPTPDARAVAAIDPKTVHIDVQNGSGIKGLGGKMAAELRARGFIVLSVENAPSFGHVTTEIHVHSAVAGIGDKIRMSVAAPEATVTPEPVPSPIADATVIVGQDYGAAKPEKQASALK